MKYVSYIQVKGIVIKVLVNANSISNAEKKIIKSSLPYEIQILNIVQYKKHKRTVQIQRDFLYTA